MTTEDAPGYRAIRWNMDWITRPLFGGLLAILTIVVLFRDPLSFAILISLVMIPAAREWHRMVADGKTYGVETLITIATVAASVLVMAAYGWVLVSLGLVVLGAVVAGALAIRRSGDLGWQVLGVLYLALPSLALVAVHTLMPRSAAMAIFGIFLIVWATDTGALICGKLIGGKRLAPTLSPGKTWSGTIGGSVVAGLVFALFIAFLQGSPLLAFVFAFLFSFTAHAGDLFESFVKRRFGLKNSGAIIPGHGGALDRMDSTLAASLALAALVFLFDFNPLIGVH